MGAVLHDTEVLHDLEDSVEGLETQVLEECDFEVVPDSDDEAMYAAEGKGFSRRRNSFVDNASPSFSMCEQQRHPVVNTDACAVEGHGSGQSTDVIVCKGNDDSHATVQSELQATTSLFKNDRTSEVKDTDLVNSISCAVSSADDSKRLSEGVEFDHDVTTHQWKIREVRIVYTRKKRRTHSFGDKVGQEEARAPNNHIECAGLSYVDSQEPEDLSKALFFVDKYVSVNVLNSSPEANVAIKDKSPPVISAKGVQSLVRLAKLRDRAQETGAFEWHDSHDTDRHSDYMGKRGQLTFQERRYDKMYVRRSANLKHVFPKKHGNPGTVLKEKIESFSNNEQRKDLSHVDSKSADCDFNIAGETKQVDEKKVREDSDAELDLPKNGDCAVTWLENGAVHEDSEHIFDVGIDTQIAAEAIQALSFAAPAACSNIDADQCRKPLGGTQKKNHAGVWSFPKKTRSASRGIVTQPTDYVKSLCSVKERTKMHIAEWNGRKKGDKVTWECLDERSFENSGKAKFMKKTNIKGAKGVNTNGFKENRNSLVSAEDMPLCKLKSRRKQRDVNPLAGNLNSSNLFYKNESMEQKIDHMKVGLPDNRTGTSAIDHTLEVPVEIENHSNLLCEKTRNSGLMKVSKDDKTFGVIDESAIDTSGDKSKERSISLDTLKVSNSMENFCKAPQSKLDDTGSTKTIQEDESYIAPQSWCLSGYPKGKRTCSSMLSHPERSCGLEYSSVKTRMEQSNHCPSKSQFYSESTLNSSSSGSNTKRKRRSSVYISPCWISSKVNSGRSFLLHSVGEPRQKDTRDNDSAAEKKKNDSEQLFESGNTVAHSEGFICPMDGARIDDGGVKSHVSDHVMSPNCPPFPDDTNLINLIDDHYEQAGKKKAILSTFSRELVRLGFNESPGLTSKDSRRRKTIANIRVLMSQNLDKATLKHLKKILTRLGVSIVYCPSDATHFIADKFARTRNMLEFIAQGKPVVTHLWLESCEQAGFHIDEKTYILRDVKKENELGFKMPLSLDLARKRPLLKGYRVSITPNAKPGLDLLTSLVKAAQGQAVDLINDCAKMTLENLLILSCEEDEDYCIPFLKRGLAAYSPELILNGIIIQTLEFERHRLFANHIKGH